MGYKLNIKRDVDVDGYPEDGEGMGTYMLNLPYGFRFADDLVHVRGYDTMAEVRLAAKRDVIACSCDDCIKEKV